MGQAFKDMHVKKVLNMWTVSAKDEWFPDEMHRKEIKLCSFLAWYLGSMQMVEAALTVFFFWNGESPKETKYQVSEAGFYEERLTIKKTFKKKITWDSASV